MGQIGKSGVRAMTYEKVKNLNSENFKRLCGVHPETFNQMLEVVQSLNSKKLKSGRPGKISLEDQLLMTLEKRARVPHLFSHWSVLGSKRIYSLPYYPQN